MALAPDPANGPVIPARELASVIEHTLLRADATGAEIDRLCAEARDHHFRAVCVHGCRVVQASHVLEGSGIAVAATAGFPLGGNDPDVKRFETEAAIDSGAQEIDVVMNIGRFKEREYTFVLRELRDIAEAADERPVKVIIETCLLSREQKIDACKLVVDSGAHYVKTSTGFSTGGATVEDVQLLRETVGDRFGIKAAGGIRTAELALALLKAGANRIGTSSGVAILRELSGS